MKTRLRGSDDSASPGTAERRQATPELITPQRREENHSALVPAGHLPEAPTPHEGERLPDHTGVNGFLSLFHLTLGSPAEPRV
ncbi:hypothetical protein EYF80_064299 [Liparis tanakae]|uniref:Uncharacterized protein n=1 Tax=Liparis tanakae TaxID=230148 RepID=A0A4Z2EAI6_9TELE|nr:hypothetical protein EYF80_064299 [Liparis tanakae]